MTALMLVASLLAAEPSPKKPRVQHIDITTDDVIEGGLKGPADTYTVTRKGSVFHNLIKVRENFDDKIVRSVDQM